MKNLTSEERRKLIVGVIVVAAVFWMALKAFRGEGLLAAGDVVGQTYSTPVGNATFGQLAVSLLISLGTLVITVGTELLKRLLSLLTPKRGAAPAGVLSDLASNRLAARDPEGYELVYQLHGRCTKAVADPPPPAA